MSEKTIIIVGGGAAGFFCAVNAARLNPELEVILIEKTNKLLAKVGVSGGGRCNVTNACDDIDEMIKKYPRGPHFLKKAFYSFFTTDTIKWFEERGVKLKTEPDNRVFPVTDSSQTVIDCLIEEAAQWGVKIWTNTEVKGIDRENGFFSVRLAGERIIRAARVCIASGGYPKSSMFQWMRNLGVAIEDPVPSLFTFNIPADPIIDLQGISLEDVSAKILDIGLSERGAVLITHWGLSGPLILKLSAWGARELASGNLPSGQPYHFKLSVNWLPEMKEPALREILQSYRSGSGSKKIISNCPFALAKRLWEYLVLQSGITELTRWAELTSKGQIALLRNLHAQVFEVKGKTTFKEEFVTSGGIQLSEINPLTMECKKIPGLYFAGEAMDVDGITGGYNFQHAWTSGYIAGKSMANR
ncbi:MAG: NAD(P)/FAD-dependent oxidoreductase [Chitinophagales bacterium]